MGLRHLLRVPPSHLKPASEAAPCTGREEQAPRMRPIEGAGHEQNMTSEHGQAHDYPHEQRVELVETAQRGSDRLHLAPHGRQITSLPDRGGLPAWLIEPRSDRDITLESPPDGWPCAWVLYDMVAGVRGGLRSRGS